ncbi:hypothetical protein [Oceanicola sp. 22II-s10i]|uniref:hypothetical protein n=1 Tax=Oceanicola sp. 22II-s10i TaxID=1317116 RepID=UPI000B526CF3|nr:hypothetical protein [Oceanicola sp. 22II-s10i]
MLKTLVMLAMPALATTCAMPGPGTEAPAGLPAAMTGSWGLTAGDCLGGAATKGLMEVTPTTLSFYESRATLTRVVKRRDNRVVAEYDFTGEGMEWSRREVFTLRGPDGPLVRQEFIDDADAGTFQYAPCD